MSKVEFTEVESESLISNIIQKQDEDTSLKEEELSRKADQSEESSQHVYIVFADGVTIDQGIEAVESKVCKGQSLQVTRRDEKGNAIVAIVASEETKAIEQLEEVSKVKIDKGAELTDSTEITSQQSAQETTAQADEKKTSSNQEKGEETELDSESEAELNSDITEDITGTNSEVTAEIRDNIDTNTKPGYLPIAIIVILGVVILLGIVFRKSKR